MKAQSELMGNLERTAEMTVPCESRATNWMNGITGRMNAILDSFANTFVYDHDIVDIGIEPALASTLDLITNSMNPEVSHRPAGQQ